MGSYSQSITLANSVIGVGILAMPFCFQQCGVLLATLMLLLSTFVSRLSCHFLLKSAIVSRRRNFEFLAFHVFGSVGKLAIEIGIIGFLMGTCIAYFVVVGDLGPQIISKIFNIKNNDMLRSVVMVVVFAVVVLPLGLLRNVDSLHNVSALTLVFYICLVFKVIGEAGSTVDSGGGDWRESVVWWRPAGVLQCLPIFSMALFCQTQLFEIFGALPPLPLERMNLVVKNALNGCMAVYTTLGLFGYFAFCTQDISGNILMSLSPTVSNDVMKLGFVLSVAFSFPLIIFPCRASIYSLIYKKVSGSQHDHLVTHAMPARAFRCITVCVAGGALAVALGAPDIELVLGLVGATIGVLVCVVFPAACAARLPSATPAERLLSRVVLALGFAMLVLGTCANLQAAAEGARTRHERPVSHDERVDVMVQEFLKNNERLYLQEHARLEADVNGKLLDLKPKKDQADDKNSVVQPPIPIAPEIQEVIKHKNEMNPKIISKLEPVQNSINRDALVLEEGAGEKESKIKVVDKKSDSIEEALKSIENKKENSVDQGKESQDIINKKQEALIETIKEHDQEQRELLKEQIKILDNMKKTKEEIDQKKKESKKKEEIDKIAVESIQKIAQIVLESKAGAEDKSVAKNIAENKQNAAENVEKVAEKAIESIIDTKLEIKQKVEEIPNDKSNVVDKKVSIGNTDLKNNLADQLNAAPAGLVQNANSQPLPHIVPAQTVLKKPENDIRKPNSKREVPLANGIAAEIVPNEVSADKKNAHVHAPDEPNSYIRGEEVEKVKEEQSVNKAKTVDSMKPPHLEVLNQSVHSNAIKPDTVVDNHEIRKREIEHCEKEERAAKLETVNKPSKFSSRSIKSISDDEPN